jgi:tetratricopeptide (TPR) repeat protein
MPFCTTCGQEIEPGAAFCAKCGTPQSQVDASSPEEILEKGNSLYDEGRYEEALVEYDRSVRMNQNNPLARLQKGMALWKLEGYQSTPYDQARYSKGAKEEFNAALKLYNVAIRQEPNNAPHHYNIARTLAFLGMEKDALREIDQAVRLEPEVAHYHWYRALVLSDLEKPREALVEVDTTLNLEPTHVDCLIMKAKIYASFGKRDEATKVLDDALRMLESDDEKTGEFFRELGNDVGGQSLNEKERGVLESFYFREMLGVARQMKPSELLRQ